MNDYTNQLLNRLKDAGIADTDSIKACSQQEISELENVFSLTLPVSYKCFLLSMGKGAGKFMRGTDCFYRYLFKLRPQAERLLSKSKGDFALSDSHFVFLGHQGYQFMFFDTTAGNDPPIFHFVEFDKAPKKVNDSFSEWLKCRVEEALNLKAETV
jgi:hypothetical protein